MPIPRRYRNPVIHDRGPSAYPGDYRPTDAALKAYGITRELFGTTEVLTSETTSFRVKDYQYVLEDGSVGMTFLPVSDDGAALGPDGEMVYGSTLVDQLLRSKMGLGPDDPIYALMYFIHPELNRGSVRDFAKTEKLLEFGVTHMGAYLGRGRTSNAPPLYHDRGWGVEGEPQSAFGYPANVLILRLKGVDQAVLNENLKLVDDVLNNGVRFPKDYKSSHFRTSNLNTALMFYKDWILQAHYLRTDETWFTYCAAHKALVASVAMNLPHNLASFKEVYGEEEGAEFFDVFKLFHFEVFGTDFTEDRETHFEPLWKQQGLTPREIAPFTRERYEEWRDARRRGTLQTFEGVLPLAPGVGMPWRPQTTADAVMEIVQLYADFVDAGAIAMCATMFACAQPATERMRISKQEYFTYALPIAQHAMEAHARIFAATQPAMQPATQPGSSFADSDWYKATCSQLYRAIGGQDERLEASREAGSAALRASELETVEDLAKVIGNVDLVPEVLVWISMERVRRNWDSIMKGGTSSVPDAFVRFMDSIAGVVEQAGQVVVRSPKGIEANMPPAIGHMLGIGMFPFNELVSVTPVVTVMNYTELERTKS